MRLPLVGAALLALFMAAPAQAQSCEKFDAIFGQFIVHPKVQSGELLVVAIPAEEIPKLVASLKEGGAVIEGEVTRAFMLAGPNGMVVGLEVDGCLLPPINIMAPLPAKGSGRLPDGRTMA